MSNKFGFYSRSNNSSWFCRYIIIIIIIIIILRALLLVAPADSVRVSNNLLPKVSQSHTNYWDYNHFLHATYSCDLIVKHFIFLNLPYFPFFSPVHLLISFLVLSITTISACRASILVSPWMQIPTESCTL